MGIFRGGFQLSFGGLEEGVFTVRTGWFRDQEVSAL